MNPLVTALATARLTQLVVEDMITQPLRDAIQERATDPQGKQVSVGTIQFAAAARRPFWGKVDEAVNCAACISVWAGAAILAANRLGPVGRFLVRVLALSQAALSIQAVIQKLEDADE
jgi:hypothetical protein